MSSIKEARKGLFQMMYSLLMKNTMEGSHISKNLIIDGLKDYEEQNNILFDPSHKKFIIDLLEFSTKEYQKLSEMISKYLTNWKFERLPKVDQTILVISAAEFQFSPSTAHAIIINEAVDMAKEFGQKESPSFINAVLDKLSKDFKN